MSFVQKTVNLLEVGVNIKAQYLEQSKKCTPWFLFQALKLTNESEINYRSSQNKRLTVELALISLCNLIALKKKVN